MTYSQNNSGKSRHIPERSCVSCRSKAEKQSLIRIVRSPEGRAVIDIAKKLDGRGVYICPDDDCIESAKKSGILGRSLGISIEPAFWDKLKDFAKSFGVNTSLKIRSVLGLARKSGTLLIGMDNIESSKKKVLVLTAKDCSESVKKFASSHENIMLDMNIDELSEAIGIRGGVQTAGLPLNSGFAKKLLNLNLNH